MFIWKEFSKQAQVLAKQRYSDDARLAEIISASDPIPEKMDDIGKPLAESVGIHQQGNIENYKRILTVRREIALKSESKDYVDYVDKVQRFISELTPEGSLYIVLIATRLGVYEFLYMPEKQESVVTKI